MFEDVPICVSFRGSQRRSSLLCFRRKILTDSITLLHDFEDSGRAREFKRPRAAPDILCSVSKRLAKPFLLFWGVLERTGALLKRLWCAWGTSWAVLEACWRCHGPSWGPLESWGVSEASPWGVLGQVPGWRRVGRGGWVATHLAEKEERKKERRKTKKKNKNFFHGQPPLPTRPRMKYAVRASPSL